MADTQTQDEVIYVVENKNNGTTVNMWLWVIMALLFVVIVIAIVVAGVPRRGPNTNNNIPISTESLSSNNLSGGNSQIFQPMNSRHRLDSFTSESPMSFLSY